MADEKTTAEQPNSKTQPDTPPTPKEVAKAEERNPLTGQPKSAGKPDPDAVEWSPPPVDEETGHTLVGDYPLSGPARALALAKAGRKTDPDGIVSEETIAAFKS